MKPVAIFRFSAEDGPGYFASFLSRHSVPWTLFKLDQGVSVPPDPDAYAGFVFMGGPMSVNDAFAWTAPVVKLIQRAIENDQPCLGHCLGGQLISKALGGAVTENLTKEIGWTKVRSVDSPLARTWLGETPFDFTAFQWHGETFAIPERAERILTNEQCMNQAFVIGKSLAMQCHTEMTPAMIEDWCYDWAAENADTTLPGVQTPEEILAETHDNIPRLKNLADQLYSKWLEGLNRESC